MEAIQQVLQNYHYVIDDLSDHRTKNWWLMQGAGPVVTILAGYLFFCIYAGPQYMKDRKPYKLTNILMVYNFLQIILSVYIAFRCFSYVFLFCNNFQCTYVDFSDSPEAIHWAGLVWWYFFAKITELLDTVFFVLRKKNNQVSFLHLYHHTIMPVIGWSATKYSAGGCVVADGGINSFIHILMYSYYFISGLGPKYQKYLWWKKYLTILQLIQFIIVVYLNISTIANPNSNHPKFINLLVLSNCVAFLYMFGKFYMNSYVRSKVENTNKNKVM